VNTLKASQEQIDPAAIIPQHETDADKIAAFTRRLRRGASFPPPVVVRYGSRFMPLDGHHRLAAHANLGKPLTAWVVDGGAFDEVDCACTDGLRAEHYVICGQHRALDVAAMWLHV
jgi:hypothetical protein